MTKKTYFYTTQLKSGEWVNLIYESASRKGTAPHTMDLYAVAHDKVELAGLYSEEDMKLNAYILNDRNKYEQCFEDYRTIDLR